MFIRDIFSKKRPVLSFEVFPPKKGLPVDIVYDTIEGIKVLNPDFISVTYGAGGSSKDRTVEIASTIKNKYKIEALAHLTCYSSTKKNTEEILKELKRNNIKNILALRGDPPIDAHSEEREYIYAKDLINHIKQVGGFSIAAACYPEGHIECKSLAKDIGYLSEKVHAGVDFLITQLFFDNEKLFQYKNKLAKRNINIPVVAGIMPVLNKNQINRMVSLSGATLPKKFVRILDKYEHNPKALKEAGIAYATEQIIDLLSWGIDGIHLYTMNKPEVANTIIRNLLEIRDAVTEEKISNE
ncbi:5,10-methylenetetrahydrofolate reductase [Proteiniborus sp. DW1]|uniref:methylenetetrahydrofolate reductase [NAD(P)H] n=1 Tax=Proteiniborus sp. DW1 TaxID=1889883 RepID=UPI00092DEF99|nr:methylenetetrahydrofolate reductase [NAD(P)H] [Proteiniborus sp. DW1]SCG84170.1 5,10-methylenetetrahydrofolate reductase [Proteiniborus sp. DW1]